jgi:hypothetical protein
MEIHKTRNSGCWFISLFNDAVRYLDYIASNDWMTVNSELGRIWKEVFITQMKALSRNFPEGTEDNHENLRQDSLYPDRA